MYITSSNKKLSSLRPPLYSIVIFTPPLFLSFQTNSNQTVLSILVATITSLNCFSTLSRGTCTERILNDPQCFFASMRVNIYSIKVINLEDFCIFEISKLQIQEIQRFRYTKISVSIWKSNLNLTSNFRILEISGDKYEWSNFGLTRY